jgi:hypothetical protein
MPRTAALGDGPIVFFTDKGEQIQVPLSAIYFDNGVVGTTRTDLPAEFVSWLSFLALRRRLVAGRAPPSEYALVVTAEAEGAAGDNIQLTVTASVDPDLVDVRVTQTDHYDNVTMAALVALLGVKGVANGKEPGLLWFTASPPSAAVPAASPNLIMIAGADPIPPTWNIAPTGATAVKLEPRRTGTGFDDATAERTLAITNIKTPTSGPVTFTLTFIWTKKVDDVAPGDIEAKLATLGYLARFTPPPGPTTTISKLPRPGSITLKGGSETLDATKAHATVLARD